MLAVLLLVTVVPGAAAYAVLERDVSLRTTLRDAPRRDDARDLSVRAVSGLARAITRTVEAVATAPALPGVASRVAWIAGSGVPVLCPDERAAPVASNVRVALLDLPPPRA